jgi:ABC transporter substrate binding protein
VNRRELIALLGSTAAAWPLGVRAQQPERVRRIGVLMAAAVDDPEFQARIGAFQQALALLGWTDGRNARIDTRWATTNADDIRRYAAELASLAPDVILAATGTTTVAPLLQATRTVPIVFVLVIDPVGAGFVESLARPGGNATGFLMFEYGLSGKWLELLKQIVPGVTRAAVLRDSAIASGSRTVRRHPVRGAVARDGSEPGQRARRRRNRARHRRWNGHHPDIRKRVALASRPAAQRRVGSSDLVMSHRKNVRQQNHTRTWLSYESSKSRLDFIVKARPGPVLASGAGTCSS